MNIAIAYNLGYDSARNGKHVDCNPLSVGDVDLFTAWDNGHNDGIRALEIIASLKEGDYYKRKYCNNYPSNRGMICGEFVADYS